MRLLELGDSGSQAERRSSTRLRNPVNRPVMRSDTLKKPVSTRVISVPPQIFPINSRPAAPGIQKSSIDIEQLLQRIDLLERRIKARFEKNESPANRQDLEQLRERVKLLERKMEAELWAARQREQSLLELLARPDPSIVFRQRIRNALRRMPIILWNWFKAAAREWWVDSQPVWWPKFISAWHEALSRAQQ